MKEGCRLPHWKAGSKCREEGHNSEAVAVVPSPMLSGALTSIVCEDMSPLVIVWGDIVVDVFERGMCFL